MSTETKVAVMGAIQLTKADIPALIAKLKEELTELKSGVDEKISLDIMYGNTKIKGVKTVQELVEIRASLKKRAVAYEEELVDLKLNGKVVSFTQSGKNLKEWLQIIDKGIFELINKEEITKRESVIKKLSNHLDEETKLKNELAEIAGEVSKPIA